MAEEDFYCRYYVGHKGKFGHEFLEFEFRPDGKKNKSVYLLHVCLCSGFIAQARFLRTAPLGCSALAGLID